MKNLFYIVVLMLSASTLLFSQKVNNNPIGDVVKQEWAKAYDGAGWDDVAEDIVVDQMGNVIVTGWSEGSAGNYDFATIKYSPSGTVLWERRYNGGGQDYAYSMVLDDTGNVYVTGSSVGSGSQDDFFTIKYNSNGDEVWTARYNGPANLLDISYDIGIDKIGNIYVTGVSNGIGTETDYTTIKYNNSGIEQWVRRYNGPLNSYDRGLTMVVDHAGDIIMTGGVLTYNHFITTTIKYTPEGDVLWIWDGISGYPYDIVVDNLNQIYITGEYREQPSNKPDFFTVKLSSAGQFQWVSYYNGPGNDHDYSVAIGVDSSFNVYVTGISRGINYSQDFATIKYDSAGTEIWVNRYLYGFINDLTLDHHGNVYVTGGTGDSATDYITIKYDPDGNELWNIKYESFSVNTATAIIVDDEFNVYITGYLEVPGGLPTNNYGTVKYSQEIVPVEIVNFTTSIINNNLVLNWSTATELNNRGFEIERGIIDPNDLEVIWENIGFISGNGTTTEPKSYYFTDNKYFPDEVYYRLKQLDFNGDFEYLPDIGGIRVNGSSPQIFSLEQNFPNPFNSSTTIKFSLYRETRIVLNVFNPLGEEMAVLADGIKSAGIHSYNFDASSLSSGIYYYSLRSLTEGGELFIVKKFIVLK